MVIVSIDANESLLGLNLTVRELARKLCLTLQEWLELGLECGDLLGNLCGLLDLLVVLGVVKLIPIDKTFPTGVHEVEGFDRVIDWSIEGGSA